MVDPRCWAIVQTITLVRDCGDRHHIEPTLAGLTRGAEDLPSITISHTLLVRLQMLGWHVDLESRIPDSFSRFSLFDISALELQYRVGFQWTQVVAASVAHRPCFAGLERTCPEDTRPWLATLEPSDQALFRLVPNDTHINHITQDAKKHCQESD